LLFQDHKTFHVEEKKRTQQKLDGFDDSTA